jgi:hypothetical protein
MIKEILKYTRDRKTAALFAAGLTLASVSAQNPVGAEPVKHGTESKAEILQQLANNRARIKQLSNLAIGQFDKGIDSGGASIWIYSGVCAVVSEILPHQPKGVAVANIVPDPGILHIVDPKTGATFAETIAYDTAQKKYVTGEIDLLEMGTRGQKVKYGRPEYNFPVTGSSLLKVVAKFSEQDHEVVTVEDGTQIPIMDSIGVVIGTNVKGIANNAATQQS